MTRASDVWSWWEAKRLRYNLAPAAAGVAAYATAATLLVVFGVPVTHQPRAALSGTLFLGVLYLLFMGAANVCYLLGAALEAWLKPLDVAAFRQRAYRLGFWGSLALPFAFPAFLLAQLIGGGP